MTGMARPARPVAPGTKGGPEARERLVAAAYELFAAEGVGRVGIDTVLGRADCAKASLYHHFGSKIDLALAFLEERDRLWTRDWFEVEVKRRAREPEERLLAVFDVLHDWYGRKDYEGCSFVRVLLESMPGTPLHAAAARHLASIRGVLQALAEEAGLAEPATFAQVWQMLIKGSMVSAYEGNRDAARQAERAAALVLKGWARARANPGLRGLPGKRSKR